MKGRVQLALYGNTAIPRGYCAECGTYAFILDGKLACCGERVSDVPTSYKRISDCVERRKGPSRKWQDYILKLQQGLCFYCERRFGSRVYRNARTIVLRINWDHVNPWTYSLDNREQNFVAACHVCNGIKSSLIFKSVEDARTYITGRREEKGYSDLPPMRIKLRAETDIADVL